MKLRKIILALATLLIYSPTIAEESNGLWKRSDAPFENWIGGIRASYLTLKGDVSFHGNTQAIYGGTPSIGMDDGRALSLTLGTNIGSGWRVQGQLAFLALQSSTSPVMGLDDRIDDVFSVDAKIESTVLMLNGFYDFDIGNAIMTPFLKGGIGLARNKTDHASVDIEYNSGIWDGSVLSGQVISDIQYPSGKATEFAWNVGAGLLFDVSEHFDLSLEYGFLDLGEALTETDNSGDALGWNSVTAESISFSIDYRF